MAESNMNVILENMLRGKYKSSTVDKNKRKEKDQIGRLSIINVWDQAGQRSAVETELSIQMWVLQNFS